MGQPNIRYWSERPVILGLIANRIGKIGADGLLQGDAVCHVGNNTRPLQSVMLAHSGAGPDSYIYLCLGPSLALSIDAILS